MQDLTLSSSIRSKKFLLKRIDEPDLEIDNAERMIALRALRDNVRFIQIRDYTIMLNAIKSIDPKPEPVQREEYYLPEPNKVEMTDAEREQALNSLNRVKKIFWTKRITGGEE